MRLFFKGGMLILEAQGMASYRKKKKLTARIFANYENIKFRPEQFSDYLLHEIGFSTGHTIAIPNHSSKGFQRPLQVLVTFFKSLKQPHVTKGFPFLFRSLESRYP